MRPPWLSHRRAHGAAGKPPQRGAARARLAIAALALGIALWVAMLAWLQHAGMASAGAGNHLPQGALGVRCTRVSWGGTSAAGDSSGSGSRSTGSRSSGNGTDSSSSSSSSSGSSSSGSSRSEQWDTINDALLSAVIQHCASGEDSYIWYDDGSSTVLASHDYSTFAKAHHTARIGHAMGSPYSPQSLPHTARSSSRYTGGKAKQSKSGTTTTTTTSSSSTTSSGSSGSGGTSATASNSSRGHVCPLIDVMLAAEDRSIGLCTDAAIYMHLLGARILPATAPMAPYTAACGSTTARLFLEPMYEQWLSPLPGAYHVFAPNFENVLASDRTLHAAMQLVLCKVKRCMELFRPYLADLGSSAQMLFTGHTSIDPLATLAAAAAGGTHAITAEGAPAVEGAAVVVAAAAGRTEAVVHAGATAVGSGRSILIRANTAAAGAGTSNEGSNTGNASRSAAGDATPPPVLPAAAAAAAGAAAQDYTSFLHVRGKSGLKHTKQLLECWAKHPEWPLLTVVGPLPNPQVSIAEARRYLAAGNIQAPFPGTPDGPGWPRFDPAEPQALAHLQATHGIHICPSEREGFGHYINEARAASAVALVPGHPPMSELVTADTGVLMRHDGAFSQEGPPLTALAAYGNISVRMSAEAICEGVVAVLAMPLQRRKRLGRNARAAFLRERQLLVKRMSGVRELLATRLGRQRLEPG